MASKKWIFLILIFPLIGTAQLFTTGFWQKLSSGLGAFSISGVTGTSDSTVDAWLVNDTNPTINFTTSSGATGYNVTIKDASDVTVACSVSNATSTSVAVSGCGLSNGTTYRVHITASNGTTNLNASNDGFTFKVDTTTPTANSISGITGVSDSTADIWLVGGLVPTVSWNAFTGASSYDVTIKDSAGSAIVCATSSTTGTSLNFSTCTLVDGTSYRAYVIAKSPSGFNTTAASNTAYSFTVDNTAPGTFSINGITGGTDSVVDANLSNGSDPTVNYGSASNTYRYDIVIKDSAGTTTVCSALNQTGSPSAVTCGLSSGQTYLAYVTAKSISTYLTTTATNNGYSFTVGGTVTPQPGDFSIAGVTGGTDATTDSWLTSGVNATANWNASAGATSYDVVIRNSADTADVCATQNTTSTSYNFSSCTLTVGTTYLIKVSAKNASATATAPVNNGFLFQVLSPAPAAFTITGATGGTDSTADDYLMSGTTVTAAWNASSGATSYDVTIRNSADTADICATQNTTATSYAFTGCTLTAGTSYLIKVVAKSTAGNTIATNSPFTFSLPATTNFCPTGSSTAKALIIYDSGGAAGNYANNESCNFTISPTGTPAQIILNFTSFASNDNGDIMTIYDGTSTAGTNLGAFKATSTAPADKTATSGNMYLTWVSSAANNAAGYNMNYHSIFSSAGAFSITGITGGADTTADNFLSDNSSGVTVAWGASTGAANYKVVIRNSSNTNDICSGVMTTGTSYNFSGCTLLRGASYVAIVSALNNDGVITAATNSPYPFTFDNRPNTFSITGLTGSSDSVADAQLAGDLIPTVNWAASSGQTSYDVVIYESDGTTEKCPRVNVSSSSTSYNFSSCTLVLNSTYKAEVVAKNANGSVMASNSLFSFQVVPVSWLTLSSTGMAARTRASAFWTGSEVIVWGGASSSTLATSINTGGRYNPTTDSWTPTSTGTNVATGTESRSSVWTGTEMVIWGGSDNNHAVTNTGSRYNPSNDTWTAMTTTSAPTARQGASIVWTGSVVVIWGGAAGSTFYNTGGIYDPSSNSWTATSTGTNVPGGREYAMTQWTGTEMFVWGGTNSGFGAANLTTGGRYNPTSNTWATVSTTNAPSARQAGAIFWSGTEVVLWGGFLTGDGFRYKPSTDTWTAISSTNAPAARQSFASVWTGTDLIVWGGSVSGGAMTNTGGRYNLATDTWTALPISGATPTARQSTAAAWTGSKMILFGGDDGTNASNTCTSFSP